MLTPLSSGLNPLVSGLHGATSPLVHPFGAAMSGADVHARPTLRGDEPNLRG